MGSLERKSIGDWGDETLTPPKQDAVACVHDVSYPEGYVPEPRSSSSEDHSKPAKEFPFTLDPFQSEAIKCLDNGESVMVSAHTSAGKTVVALYAVAMSLRNKQRVMYISPIKALSNQKYREFKEEFSDVGLMTGDVTIEPNASCLVMTTEIWRSMQYKGSEIMREVAWIIFDEVHYMRDREQGVIWEESIVTAPKNSRFVFLSATVPDAKEFAHWVGKVHHQPCHIVYTDYRPTPLQHYIFPSGGDGLYLVVDEKGKFYEDSFQKALNALVPAGESDKKRENGKWQKSLVTGRVGEESDIFKMVKMIIQHQYDPVICFSSSKGECEFLAMQMAKMDLNEEDEKVNIETIFWSAMDMLSDNDKKLPQVTNMLPLLKRGISVHHSGLLPILKEVIEILFQEGLIKCLFATETFSIGLNMPARTVVFTNVRKFDGDKFRWISSGEYTQMSGRVGRRGIDKCGICILMVDEKLEPSTAKMMLKGSADSLNSCTHPMCCLLDCQKNPTIEVDHMAEPICDEDKDGGGGGGDTAAACDQQGQLTMGGSGPMSRKEKRKAVKKMKRKQLRKEAATKAREEEEARLNNPEERRRIELVEEDEEERRERESKEFEERERAWIEAIERKKKEEEEEDERAKALEESRRQQVEDGEHNQDDGDDWEYVEEDGPAEIIWQGNEIILKKKTIRVAKKGLDLQMSKEDADRPTSNPLLPQSETYLDYSSTMSAQQVLEYVALQVSNFGTEQDKAHCPFHLKTGACRFGQRCSRAHFYPDKSCTLLIKNMYNGPGLAWEQDEGLEYTNEEVECSFEEFYGDVHTEFLKFGEIVNFKACKNGSFHLRGNVYVHYKSMDSAVLAYNSINGRFFAGKQVKCEFVNVTKWKVAICGEYMKSRFKTCSHGTACNFIHCFRNPGGDYEWADWDKSPPKYWVSKMAALFGYSPKNDQEEKIPVNLGRRRNSSKNISFDSKRGRTRRSSSRGKDYFSSGRSEESYNEKNGIRDTTHREHDEEQMKFNDKKEKMNLKNCHHSRRRTPQDEDGHQLAVDTDEERRHGDARKRSRHRNDLGFPDENGDIKRTRYCVESDGSKSDMDEDEQAHRARSRRHTERHKTINNEDRSERTHDADFPLHCSSRDRHDGYSKHRSSKHKKRSRSSDNDSMSSDIRDRWDPQKYRMEDS